MEPLGIDARHFAMPKIVSHVPRPRTERRQAQPAPKVADQLAGGGPVTRFNTLLSLKITAGVGTMWCACAFAALALVSLPTALRGGISPTVTWTAQTFLQLVLLSIIIVGQNVLASAADARAQVRFPCLAT